MGNFSCLKGRRRRCKYLKSIDANDDIDGGGIRSVGVQSHDDLSRSCDDLCICILTWNMNGQVCYEDLVELVGKHRKLDLLVIGLQEVPRKNISKLLQDALSETHMLLGKSVMQSLQLYVFGPCNSDLFTRELEVDKESIGCLGGLIGRKKGAVAMRINYKGLVMVFISCHLSAHACNVKERNSEFNHISESLFPNKLGCNHITVWLGDLNYRVQGITTHPARNLIHHNLHTLLTTNDQLLKEAQKGQIFQGYHEGTLTFKPTYKYDVGTNNYDTSYKVRVPSWTDRILFKIEDADTINATLHTYQSIDTIHSSDHKPVIAHLCIHHLLFVTKHNPLVQT